MKLDKGLAIGCIAFLAITIFLIIALLRTQISAERDFRRFLLENLNDEKDECKDCSCKLDSAFIDPDNSIDLNK